MVITYIPPKLETSTREIAIQKGKYIIGYMQRYQQGIEGQLNTGVNLEVVSEETNDEYTIQQELFHSNGGLVWTIFKDEVVIGDIQSNPDGTKKHRIIANVKGHLPIQVTSTWKRTGKINKKGSTVIKGLFNHKIQIDSLHELKEVDSSLLASIVYIFWSSQEHPNKKRS
ncbi:hypothetical protein [Halobacillus campisalis]|uniref:Uncharacterized protein n=1 Tax=Halobacillus campisalis TaxID=435909 RepID=A0ABW2K5A9_9BACI|nr:hypothetical protein [Halobacillus campisalis]